MNQITPEQILEEAANVLGITTGSLNLLTTFISNGGDSLSSLRLHKALRTLGLDVPLEVIFGAPTLSMMVKEALLCTQFPVSVRPRKRSRSTAPNQVLKLQRTCFPKNSHDQKAELHDCETECGLTEMQESLIQSSRCHHGRNIIWYFEMHLPRNIPALKAAWRAVIEGEPIFQRDVLGHGEEHSSASPFSWSENFVHDQAAFQQELMRRDLPTDVITSDFKVVTETFPGGRSVIGWRVHHAMIDGCSRDLLLAKVQKCLKGEVPRSGPSFQSFGRFLRNYQEKNREAARTYWTTQKKKHPNSVSELLLPSPHWAESKTSSMPVDEVMLSVDLEEMSKTCQQQNITSATLLHGAWALTLTKYVDSYDVTFGSVLSGRTLPFKNMENLVGPTINTLPLMVLIDVNLTVKDFLRHIFTELLELTRYQWSKPEHGFKRKFASALNYQLQTSPHGQSRYAPTDLPYTYLESDIPLLVDVSSSKVIRLVYRTDVYVKSQIQKVARTFLAAICALSNAKQSIATCLDSLLDSHDLKRLGVLGNWASTSTRTLDQEEDLVTLFDKVASEYPRAVAVQKGNQRLTYSELKLRASTVAQLIARWISPGDVVCVHADRSMIWIIAIYAVLRAGGVYCPFVESLPASLRNEYFLQAGASMFIGTSIASKAFCPTSCENCLSIEELLSDTPSQPGVLEQSLTASRPNSNAYLCFTSGSTGKPKGVLCTHRGLVAFQKDVSVRLNAQNGWRIAQVMSPGFDGSIHEIFSALSYGATLILCGSDSFSHIAAADAVVMTPSLAQILNPDEYPMLKMVYLVGEVVSQTVCDVWTRKKTAYNMFGPTEATCGSTIKKLESGKSVTLGRPNPSTRIYILNSQQHLVPRGVIGEIYLAGVQIAQGYISRPEETALRFMSDVINPQYNERMYRTGDRGYWNEEGELVFVGRMDRQVKLHGFRIDLDDLETRILKELPCCSSVAATKTKDGDLVALVQPKSVDVSNLRLQLTNHVPPYSIPRYIRAVNSFPLTSVGKVDYRAILGNEEPSKREEEDYSANEAIVIKAIQEVLDTSANVPATMTLHDLGIDSMMYMRLSSHFKTMLRGSSSVTSFSIYSTIRELVQLVESSKRSQNVEKSSDRRICNELGDRDISPVEETWWRKYQYRGGSSAFNLSFTAELGQGVDIPKLIAVWNEVLAHYPILRSHYSSDNGTEVMRRYTSDAPRVIEHEEINIIAEINSVFDLKDTHVIRVLISRTRMVVVISHIICDLTTLKTLLRDVSQVYHGESLSRPARLYSHTRWNQEVEPWRLDFWCKYLRGAPQPFCSMTNSMKRSSWTGTSRMNCFSQSTYEAMKTTRAKHKVSMHQMALAAIALAISQTSGNIDIIMGAPYLNRQDPEDQEVVGLFLEPLPIRIQYPNPVISSALETTGMNTVSFLQEVQRSSRLALSFAVPWGSLLSQLSIKSEAPENPLFDVMVTFHEASHFPKLDIEGIQYMHTWAEGAKFKLMAEFTETEVGGLMVRFEYSDECFSKEDIVALEGRVALALDGLSREIELIELRSILVCN